MPIRIVKASVRSICSMRGATGNAANRVVLTTPQGSTQ